jgi:hypothetical protein
MSDTIRHEGFGLPKQNTAGLTAPDSRALGLSQISWHGGPGVKKDLAGLETAAH